MYRLVDMFGNDLYDGRIFSSSLHAFSLLTSIPDEFIPKVGVLIDIKDNSPVCSFSKDLTV